MEIYSTEEQQEEAIKRFFRENGLALAIGIVIRFRWFIWLESL